MSNCLGIDTSNYTTSAAVYRSEGTGCNCSRLLDVEKGSMGLRQSDALFQHVKQLPKRFQALKQECFLSEIAAVGASTRPRAVEGSYMPCFLAGASQGQVLADTLHVPFYEFSHQQGHIAAACWSAGQPELLNQPILAWHLSGGTTELLMVVPENGDVRAARVGGTTDISAGQLIDRTGKLLKLEFPAGKALDVLANETEQKERFRVRLDGLEFSFSGMENQVQRLIEKGAEPSEIARYALLSIASLVRRATDKAKLLYPGLPVLCSGGVASNSILRAFLYDAVFAAPEFSTDNAMGIAILAERRLQRGE